MGWAEDIDLPAIFQAISSNQEALEVVEQLNETISFGNSALSRMQEEAIATVVAVANRCTYSALTHGGFFRRHTGDGKLASHLLNDYSGADLDPRDLLMLDFAVRLTREPSSLTTRDLEGLRRAGFDQKAIVSIVLITCLSNFMNRLATSFGVEVPPAYLKVVKSWLSGPAAQEGWLIPQDEVQPDATSARKLGIDIPRGRQGPAGQVRPGQRQQDTEQELSSGRQNPAGQGRPGQRQQDAEQEPSRGRQSGPQRSQLGGEQRDRGDSDYSAHQLETEEGFSAGDPPDIQQRPSGVWQDPEADIFQSVPESDEDLDHQNPEEPLPSLDRFISDCCIVASGESSTARDMYISYLRWSDDNGEHALLQRNFGIQLTQLGFSRRRRSGGRHWWQGIGLRGQ